MLVLLDQYGSPDEGFQAWTVGPSKIPHPVEHDDLREQDIRFKNREYASRSTILLKVKVYANTIVEKTQRHK